MTTDMYIVRTVNGYVGRMGLAGDLSDTMPRGFAYTWSAEEADLIAARFGGQTVALAR